MNATICFRKIARANEEDLHVVPLVYIINTSISIMEWLEVLDGSAYLVDVLVRRE